MTLRDTDSKTLLGMKVFILVATNWKYDLFIMVFVTVMLIKLTIIGEHTILGVIPFCWYLNFKRKCISKNYKEYLKFVKKKLEDYTYINIEITHN